ncbi:MAG: BMP family ABC transporter substrate-binding protein [Chloroflexota bacterium]
MKSTKSLIFVMGIIMTLILAACSSPEGGAGTAAAECGGEVTTTDDGGFSIPEAIEGCYNVGFVYIGPHDDGGWTQAHDLGRQYVQENVEGVHTAYVELVPEGADAEQVIRSLARKGFDVIFTTSFGYMDPSELVASEFPDVDIIHVSGFKSNGENFGNLFGAMETMKYINGMIAGSRAMADGNPKLGYMPTFPIPEELRLGNAFALGAAVTCPDCTIDIRWIGSWHDPILEQEAAKSLFDAGAQVVMNGADTQAAAQAAPDGKWGVNYNYINACQDEKCLTSAYWNWGIIYADIVERSKAGTYEGGSEYFDADTGAMGLWGLMDGQELTAGMTDLPEEDLTLIQDTFEAAMAGEFDRFDVFAGPIVDNQGNVVLEDGESLEQIDLDGFSQFGSPCGTCMYWWNENFNAELPEL